MNRHDGGDLPHYRDSGLGYQAHSEASKDGARAALPKKPTQESRCLDFIKERGRAGATSDVGYLSAQTAAGTVGKLLGLPVVDETQPKGGGNGQA
ncbi:MAG TPA: hypothetical protein VN034_06475 [Sphingopyxis sp.]|nr:hypothetical protein [Sphingopyxis sp.]